MDHERNTHPDVLSASTLIGDDVRNRQGESLGNLEEIMLDLDMGRVAYAVLSFDSFLGIGGKFFAIPWEAISVDTDNEEIVLDVSKEMLENAPGFDKDNWPKTSNRDWMQEIHSYYGYDPYWQ